MKLFTLILSMNVAFLAGWGCSDKSKGGGNDDTDTGDIDSVPVVELTDEQMAAFCSELYDETLDRVITFYESSPDEACQLAGAIAAEMAYEQGTPVQAIPMACQLAITTCGNGDAESLLSVTTSATELPASEGEFCVGVQDMFDGCNATTSEMSTCYLAFVDAELADAKTSAAELPECAAYTSAYFETDTEGATDVPDLTNLNLPLPCLSLALKCPQLLTSMTSLM